MLPFTTRVLRWLISCVHILVDFNLIDVSSNQTIWKIFLVYYVDVVPFQENPVHSCWLLLFSLLVQSCCLLLILFLVLHLLMFYFNLMIVPVLKMSQHSRNLKRFLWFRLKSQVTVGCNDSPTRVMGFLIGVDWTPPL